MHPIFREPFKNAFAHTCLHQPHPACTRGCRSRRISPIWSQRDLGGDGPRRGARREPRQADPLLVAHHTRGLPPRRKRTQRPLRTQRCAATLTRSRPFISGRHTALRGTPLRARPSARPLRPARGPAKALSHTHTQRARTARAHARQPTGRRGADEPPRQTEGKTNETRQDNLRRSPRRNAHVYTRAPYSLPACHSRPLFRRPRTKSWCGEETGPTPAPPRGPAAAAQAHAATPSDTTCRRRASSGSRPTPAPRTSRLKEPAAVSIRPVC